MLYRLLNKTCAVTRHSLRNSIQTRNFSQADALPDQDYTFPKKFGRQTMLKKELRNIYETAIKNLQVDTDKLTVRQTTLHTMHPTTKDPIPLISAERNFLHGFEEEDFKGFNPILKRAFQLSNANEGQILKFKKNMAIRKYQREETDTGSSLVRCAIISEQILNMITHMRKRPTDTKTFRYIAFIHLLNICFVRISYFSHWFIKKSGLVVLFRSFFGNKIFSQLVFLFESESDTNKIWNFHF